MTMKSKTIDSLATNTTKSLISQIVTKPGSTNVFGEVSVVARARMFAEFHHGMIGQKRKYTGVPYIRHPANVVGILAEHDITDEYSQAVAWMHDTVEDTAASIKEITRYFGMPIANGVAALTDVGAHTGNRKTRKAIDRARIAKASLVIRRIKAADCIDNLSDIALHDPKFAKTYISEIQSLADAAFDDKNVLIFDTLNAAIYNALNYLNGKANG